MIKDQLFTKDTLPKSIRNFVYARHNNQTEEKSPRHIGKIISDVFTIFTTEENNGLNKNDLELKPSLTVNYEEIQCLRDLENCANAARETGICGQREIDK